MSSSAVNVFSKQARFQDLGPIPSNAGDLHGWPITKDFILSLILSCWKFMSNSVVNAFSKQARFQDLGQIPSNRGDPQGWPITMDSFLSLVFMLEIYVQFSGQRFLETGEV